MHALILAAGFGTRLGPLGEQVPKALLPIGSRRAIDFVLAAAEAVPQIRRVDVVGNQRFHAQLAAWAATSGATRPLRVWNDGARRPEERRGAIGDVAWWLKQVRPTEPVLVLASDNVFDFALDELAEGGHPGNLGYFIEWLHVRTPVRGLLMEGRWIDVGTVEEHGRATRVFAP